MKDLNKKLAQFREIEPDEKYWHVSRSILMNTIEVTTNNTQGQHFGKSLFFNINMFFRYTMPSFKMATVSLVVIATILTTGFGAQAAMPGNPLYYVKKGMEKMELVLVKEGSIEETNIRIKHASKRLAEINYLLEKDSEDKNIGKVSEDMTNNLNTVKDNFKNISKTADKEKVVELAKLIDQNSLNTSKTLRISSVEIMDEKTNQAINDVMKINTELGIKALEVMLSEEELGETEQKLINESIQNKIELLQDNIVQQDKNITEAREGLINVDLISGIDEVDEVNIEEEDLIENTTSTIPSEGIIEFNINRIVPDSEQVTIYLEEARKLAAEGRYEEALIEIEKVQLELDLMSKLDDVLKEKVEKMKAEIEAVKSATEQVLPIYE